MGLHIVVGYVRACVFKDFSIVLKAYMCIPVGIMFSLHLISNLKKDAERFVKTERTTKKIVLLVWVHDTLLSALKRLSI